MAAVRSLCQKGVVLRDGMTDFMGTADDAVNHYLETASYSIDGFKPIKDFITQCKTYIKIDEIKINNTPYNYSLLSHGQEVLDILVKGYTQETTRCEIKMVIKKPDDTPMAAFIEGHYKGKVIILEAGEFTIKKRIKLPKYMADGSYIIDFYLHDPNVQYLVVAKNCMTLKFEGFYEQFTRTLELSKEGFIGLESV